MNQGGAQGVTPSWRGSIQTKYLATVVSVLALMSLLVGGYLANNQARLLRQFIDDKGKELASYLAKICAQPLLDGETMTLDTNAMELCKAPDILYAAVLDKQGKIVTSRFSSFNRESAAIKAVKDKLPPDSRSEEIIRAILDVYPVSEQSAPVILEEATIGKVLIGISTSRVKREFRSTFLSVLAAVALVGLITSGVLVIISKKIVLDPLAVIARVSRDIARGDFTQRVPVKTRDEIGALGDTFNQLVDYLSLTLERIDASFAGLDEIASRIGDLAEGISQGSAAQVAAINDSYHFVREITTGIKSVSQNVENLFVTAERSASSTQEMSASINQVARNAEILSTNVDNTSATVRQTAVSISQVAGNVENLFTQVENLTSALNEISSSIKEVEGHAHTANQLAEKVTATISGDGQASVDRAVQGMKRIQEAIARSSVVIQDLGSKSRGIDEILTIINDVADRTSLLSLNANILAAQAGEHGQGFLIIAKEIRKLAESTSKNTKQIAGLIAAIQQETGKAVEVMGEGLHRVDEGVLLIGAVEETLRKVRENSVVSADATKIIAQSTTGQLSGAGDIAASAENMSQMAKEIAASTKEQAQGAAQITRATEEMGDMANQLKMAAVEQTRGAGQLSNTSEQASNQIKNIFKTTQDQSVGSDRILTSMEQVQEVAEGNTHVVTHLKELVESLGKQATLLKSDLARFTTKRS